MPRGGGQTILSTQPQLRNGILPLQLEVGRWTNKAVEERLCLICNNGTVEDEEHFHFIVISITVSAKTFIII